MKDYIFIIGPSGVGKTTLAKGLYKHYKCGLEKCLQTYFSGRSVFG